MRSVKMLADVVDVARRSADRWYVSTGHAAVGPVNLDLIARGVQAGKVPLEAFVRHEAWKVWRPITELAEISSVSVGPQAAPHPGAPPSRQVSMGPQGDADRASTDDIAEVGRPSTPDDFSPADAVEGASDHREALALLMTSAVVRGAAEAALVHLADDEGAAVVCAHGAHQQELVGARTALLDPALVAASAGVVVVAEPDPGPAGRAILGRLSRLAGGAALDGALMIPIRPRDRLLGMIELGRAVPFRTAEIAALEALVDALVAELERWDR
jgi:hypothetical protein